MAAEWVSHFLLSLGILVIAGLALRFTSRWIPPLRNHVIALLATGGIGYFVGTKMLDVPFQTFVISYVALGVLYTIAVRGRI